MSTLAFGSICAVVYICAQTRALQMWNVGPADEARALMQRDKRLDYARASGIVAVSFIMWFVVAVISAVGALASLILYTYSIYTIWV